MPRTAQRLPRAFAADARAQRGLTIIELMVSITIGLLIVGAVLYVYMSSRGAYHSSKMTSRVQEAGRFGLDAILRDVRQAGFLGCGSRISLGTMAPPTLYQIATPALAFSGVGQAVQGAPHSAWTDPPAFTVPSVASDDVLQLHVPAAGASIAMAQPPDPTKPAIFLANNCGGVVKTDAMLLVSSCSMATVLRVSNTPDTTSAACPANGAVANGGAGVEVDYAATDAKGKTINVFPNGSTALTPNNSAPTLTSRPTTQAFDEVTYYVGRLAGRPATALYRYSLLNGVSEEIIDHVDNMCVQYGLPGAGGINYVDAATVGAAWSNVVSVRVSLYATGDDPGVVDAAQQPTLPWCGGPSAATITPTDTKFHQVFTATAALRDQLQ